MRAIATDGAHACLRSGITTVGDCSFAGAAAEAASATGLRAIVYLEVFGRDGSAMDRFGGAARSRRARALRTGSPSAYRRTRRTPAPSSCTRRAPASACRPRRTSRRASPSASSSSTGRATGRRSPRCSCRRPAARASACWPVPACSARASWRRTASTSRTTRSRCSPQHGVGVAHCPRSNGILGCGIAPLARLLDAGIPVGIATDSPASTPSFDLFEELRTAIVAARARERRPDALSAHRALELATLGGARVLGLDAEVGSLVAGQVGRPGRGLARRLPALAR